MDLKGGSNRSYFSVERVDVEQDAPHPDLPLNDPPRMARELWTDEVYGPVQKSILLVWWENGRVYLLVLLLILPWLLLSPEVIHKAWISSLFGLLACCLPSGGAPIAGGIVFIPALQAIGLTSSECVTFCALTQTFGCGVFAPANWLAKDPGILIYSSMFVMVPAGIFGLWLSLFVLRIENDDTIRHLFAAFCVFLIFTVIHGLYHTLTTQNEPVSFLVAPTSPAATFTSYQQLGSMDHSSHNYITIQSESTKLSVGSHSNSNSNGSANSNSLSLLNRVDYVSVIIYAVGGVIGGLLAGYIGIGIEKFLFLLLTFYHHADVRRATITAIAVIGILSAVASVLRIAFITSSSDLERPLAYWVCALPGVLFGSMIGPKVNALIGSRRVMLVFCLFLVINVVIEARSWMYSTSQAT